MTKRFVIVAALMTLGTSLMAQEELGLQVSLMLGNANLFNQDLSYVLPRYSDNNIGIGSTYGNQSSDPGIYLNLNNLGTSNLTNMAGIQFAYYVGGVIDANLSFGMDIRSTPKKNYVENVDVSGLNVQGEKWIEGQLKNNWVLNLGGNFHVTQSKIDAYGGLRFGIQQGKIATTTPYTDYEADYLSGDDNTDATEKKVLYYPRTSAGKVNCTNISIVAGVQYAVAKGLYLGVEFAPYSFQYSVLRVNPTGGKVYEAVNYANRFFATPMLKLGFRL